MIKIKTIISDRIACCSFILLGLAVLLSGCAAHRVEVKPDEIHPIHINLDIRSHLWAKLFNAGDEPAGYAMYTYVLIKRNEADSAALSRYNALVKEILSSTSAAAEYGSGFDRSLYNLFLVPYEPEKDENAEKLNFILSKSILTSIAASVEKQELRDLINTNPGPFLVSSTEPISDANYSADTEMLYYDLTRTNIDAMAEVVAIYKKRLTSDEIQGIERFKSIKMSILNFMLDADDYINIVKVAYAGWVKE